MGIAIFSNYIRSAYMGEENLVLSFYAIDLWRTSAARAPVGANSSGILRKCIKPQKIGSIAMNHVTLVDNMVEKILITLGDNLKEV